LRFTWNPRGYTMSLQPHTPPRVDERLNLTLMESAHAMLAQAGLPEKYWAEAVATAAYLRNRTVTRALKEKMTPYENGMVENLILHILECLVTWLMHMHLTVTERES